MKSVFLLLLLLVLAFFSFGCIDTGTQIVPVAPPTTNALDQNLQEDRNFLVPPETELENCGVVSLLFEGTSDDFNAEADPAWVCIGKNILNGCTGSKVLVSTEAQGSVEFSVFSENNECFAYYLYGEGTGEYAGTDLYCSLPLESVLLGFADQNVEELPGSLGLIAYLFGSLQALAPESSSCSGSFLDITNPIENIDLNMDYNSGFSPDADFNQQGISYCDSLTGYAQLNCYLEYAILLNDYSLCEEKTGIYSGVCLGVLSNNCSEIEALSFKEYCHYKLGIKNSDESQCNLISGEDYLASCIAGVNGSPQGCSALYRDSCFFELALREKNPSYCYDAATNPANYFFPSLCLTILNDQNIVPDQNQFLDGNINEDENIGATEPEPVIAIIPSDSHGTLNPATNRRDFNILVSQSGFTPSTLYGAEGELFLLRIQALDNRHNFYSEYQEQSGIITLDKIVEKDQTVAVSFRIPAQSEIGFSCYVNCDSSVEGKVVITLSG